MKKHIAMTLCVILILSLFAFPMQVSAQTQVTPEQIVAVQQIYPEGMICINSTPEFFICVHWPGVLMNAQGCWGFAILFVGKLYNLDLTKSLSVTCLDINISMPDCYPKTPYCSARESVAVGDILAVSGHAMVVIGTDNTGVTIGEGNYGGRVHYGRHLSYEYIDQHSAYILRIIPPESGHDCPCSCFNDMPADWTSEHVAIDWAYTHDPKLTVGTSSVTFSPNDTVTRAQALTFLWREAGMPEPTTNSCSFTDISEGSYYYNAVLWAVENGITCGTSSVSFSPSKACSRAEIITFLWRAMNSPSPEGGNPFSDVSTNIWYYTSVLWASENGIENGQGNHFNPCANCTRASTLLYFYRVFEPNHSS